MIFNSLFINIINMKNKFSRKIQIKDMIYMLQHNFLWPFVKSESSVSKKIIVCKWFVLIGYYNTSLYQFIFMDQPKFTKHLLFKSQITFNPATLNNLLYTYYLAHQWQKRHTRGETKQYSFEKWIQFINNVIQMRADLSKFFAKLNTKNQQKKQVPNQTKKIEEKDKVNDQANKQKQKQKKKDADNDKSKNSLENKSVSQLRKLMPEMIIFVGWSVYGDGMSFLESKVLGILDTQAENPYLLFDVETQQNKMTSKIGQNRGVICQMDVNGQVFSKWYNFRQDLQINNERKVLKFHPNSFRNLTRRITKLEGDMAVCGDWYFVGDSQTSYFESQKHQKNKLLNNILDGEVFLRQSQYRYSAQTKISSAIGFISDAQTNIASPNMQGWRRVIIPQKDPKKQRYPMGLIHFKSVKDGLLIDFCAAVWDQTEKGTLKIVYPNKYYFKLECQSKTIIEIENLDIDKLSNKQGGLFFKKGVEPIKPNPVKVTIKFDFHNDSTEYFYEAIEDQYFITMAQSIVKSQLTKEKILFEDQYQNFIENEFYCTRYGEKVNEVLRCNIKEESQDGVLAGTDQFNTRGAMQSLSFQQKVQNLLKFPEMKQKYQSYEHINKVVFGNKLSMLSEVADVLTDKICIKKGKISWKLKRSVGKIEKMKNIYEFVVGKKKQECQEETFKVLFQSAQPDGSSKVKFVNGKAKIKFILNADLTPENNPRHQVCTSLSFVISLLFDQKNSRNQIQSDQLNLKFFEVEDPLRTNKVDWVHDISPILKVSALLYPSMQKIIGLYTLSNLQMSAMRRSFAIEDERSPRYMPATREISAIDHKKIRKWLYDPIFDYSKIHYGDECFKKFKKNHFLCVRKINHNYQCLVKEFNHKKLELIHDLRTAFKIQMTTIPLYLGALFSSNHNNTINVLRQILKQEMKHQFIVSNVLNAVFDEKLEPNKKAVPFKDPKYIPTYPIADLPVLNVTNNDHLKNFLKFDIAPCNEDQILRFMCIQLPGDIRHIYLKHPDNCVSQYFQKDNVIDVKIKKLKEIFNQLKEQLDKYPSTFKTIGQYYSEIIEKFWHLDDLQKYINEIAKKDKREHVKIFTGDQRKQFNYFGLGEMIEVYDLKSALDQFRQIVEEGEGVNLYSETNYKNQYCHFVRFIEIYTGCDVTLQVKNMDTNKPEINFNLKRGDYYTPPKEADPSQKNWVPQHDKIADKEIEKYLCSQFADSSKSYPDAYAKVAFMNNYEDILSDLDFVFNIDFNLFRKEYEHKNNCILTDDQFNKILIEERKLKMELSISKMRQMRIHADRVINPLAVNTVKPNPNVGSRPNFNIDYSNKSQYFCKPEETKKQ